MRWKLKLLDLFHQLWKKATHIWPYFFRRIRLFLSARRFRIKESARKTHTYIVAGTGAWKSELLKSFIRQHAMKRRSAVIVIDPNGDFAEQVVKFYEFSFPKERNRLVYIDPGLSPDHTPVINPFELSGRDEDTKEREVQQMMKLLLQVFQSMGCAATSPMELLLLACLQVVCNLPSTSLRDLWRFMDDQINQDLVAQGKKHSNPDIRLFFENQFHQQGMMVSKEGLKTRLFRLIGQARFTRLVTGSSTINLKKVINQKKIIVFNLSKGRLGSDFSMIYGRFLLNSIMNILLARAVIPEKFRVPTHLYVDEFHNYIDATMREVFTEGRKYKAYLTVATQMVGQQMTTNMKDTILGNANVKIIGKAGQKSQRALFGEMGVDELTEQITGVTKKTFKKLQRWKFIVQISNREPRTIKNGTWLLGNKHSMSPKAWEAIVQEQIKLYYKERSVDPQIPIAKESGKGFRRPFKKQLQAHANISDESSNAQSDGYL